MKGLHLHCQYWPSNQKGGGEIRTGNEKIGWYRVGYVELLCLLVSGNWTMGLIRHNHQTWITGSELLNIPMFPFDYCLSCPRIKNMFLYITCKEDLLS